MCNYCYSNYRFDDGENTNNDLKALYVKYYTEQRLNRRRKPQEPINKLKVAEFLYMLEGKLY